jgi:redox-sensing transcriptional repressor
VVIRLSRYKNVLYRLKSLGFVRVFSDNLADALGISPALVRKDFSVFGISGNKRGGYRIEDLIAQLGRILGKDEVQKVVLVGCGKIGTALMAYRGFAREQIRIAAGFDVNPSKLDPKAPIPILDMGELPGVIAREGIKVAIVTVPETAAGHVVETLIAAGIRGILNFAPISLKSSDACFIHNINIALELENLFYFVRFADQESLPADS